MTAPDAIDRVGRREFGEIYGGLACVHDCASIEIYLTKPSFFAEAAFVAESHGLPVRFRTVPQSLDSLEALQNRLGEAMPRLRLRGVLIASSWTVVRTGRLSVEVVHLKAGDEQTIASVIGSRLFDVHDTPGLQVATVRTASGSSVQESAEPAR
jgi:hypothetical protein